ncbi:MAG: hypothetical protein KatS3mg061_3178 [Dehalococcoidia bacterium]|nr:MAG: hypothetical protein KatS3mg061_3178 [Dehalococcoidia bacterium]
MGQLWTEQHKLDLWLKVEIAACEGWAAIGVIPPEDLAVIRTARYDLAEVAQYFRETHHDMTAFLRSVQQHLGPPGRWIHYGLTSSDVIDTALSLQLVEALDLLLQGAERLEQAIHAPGARSPSHAPGRADTRRPRRADLVWNEAGRLDRRGAARSGPPASRPRADRSRQAVRRGRYPRPRAP